MRILKQSSTAQPLVFLMIDSTDHISGKPGLSPTVTLSKSGGSFASPAGAVTEIGSGWYKVAGNATDTGTLGPLILHATATGADPVDVEFAVVAFDPQVGTNLGLSAIPTASPGAANGLFIAGTNAATTVTTSFTTTFTGNLTGSVGSVTAGVTLADGAITTAKLGTFVLSKTTNITGFNDLSASSVEGAVWDAVLSGYTDAGSAGKIVGDNLNATVGSRAATGDAMTLTGGERTAIANEVEAQIIDDTDSEKVLEAITNKIASVNPSLSGLTLAAIASQVWSSGTRSLTEKTGFELTTAYDAAKTAASQTSVNDVKATTDKIDDTLEDDAGTYRFTANALEQAPTGGGGGGFTWNGARAVTITVTDSTPTALSSAVVRITQGASSQPLQTDVNGQASFSLDDGAYTLTVTKGGYSYTPTTITVAADATAFDAEMTALVVPAPSAGQCTGTMVVLDEDGDPEAGVTIYFEACGIGTSDGFAYDSTAKTSVSDDNGVISRTFPSGGVAYRWRRGTGGEWMRFKTALASGATFNIPSGVGKT